MPTELAVIIPCYNTERYVTEAIDSAKAMGGCAPLIVVVNDGSTDRSGQILRATDGIELVEQKNAGLANARNAGIEAAGDAEWLLFLDADDRVLPETWINHRKGMEESPDSTMLFGSNHLIDVDGNRTLHNVQTKRAFGARDVAGGVTPAPVQCLYRGDAVRAAGGFTPGLRSGEDSDLNLRILAPTSGGWCHGHDVAEYRQHAGQMTKSPTKLYRGHIDVLAAQYGPEGRDPDPALLRRLTAHWKRYYGQFMLQEAARMAKARRAGAAFQALGSWTANLPMSAVGTAEFLSRRARRR